MCNDGVLVSFIEFWKAEFDLDPEAGHHKSVELYWSVSTSLFFTAEEISDDPALLPLLLIGGTKLDALLLNVHSPDGCAAPGCGTKRQTGLNMQ